MSARDERRKKERREREKANKRERKTEIEIEKIKELKRERERENERKPQRNGGEKRCGRMNNGRKEPIKVKRKEIERGKEVEK